MRQILRTNARACGGHPTATVWQCDTGAQLGIFKPCDAQAVARERRKHAIS